MEKFKIECHGSGFTNGKYPGAFQNNIEKIIKKELEKTHGRVLHLFSGSSRIGDVRVDIDNENATVRGNVKEFLENCNEKFSIVLLDPPYLVNASDLKQGYKISRPFSCNIPLRRYFENWALRSVEKVIWLDVCTPLLKGFKREKVYFFLSGGYRTIRALSILKKVRS